MTTVYEQINNMERVVFVAGTKYTFEFFLYDENNVALDASAATLVWRLAIYGQPENTVLEKNGVFVSDNELNVILDSNDTLSLSGNYIQQADITDGSGNKFIPGQGIVTIVPKIADI